MALEAELIGRSLGLYLPLGHGVAGVALALLHREVQVFLEESGGITGMGGVALQTAALHRIAMMCLFEGALFGLMTGATLGIWLHGQ